jgi:muramoyltetrapeptide carboxypeptidase
MISTLADTDELTKDALLTALTADTRLKLTPKKGWVIRPGSASGAVVGGNLTTLCHLVGTPYEPELKGRILLLEDKGEAAYRIDRMLSQMKLAGCFEDMAGLILGSFEGCGDMAEICRITKEIFEDEDIPILSGFDVGHGKTNITIPLGLEAFLDTDRQELVFREPATAD